MNSNFNNLTVEVSVSFIIFFRIFLQLLRRCVFVILRRDMSLNRRLYQWILNRSGDSSVGALPIGGVDEQLDTTFFRCFSFSLCYNYYFKFVNAEC